MEKQVSKKFAVVEIGGTQQIVHVGEIIKTQKIETTSDTVTLDKVLLLADEQNTIIGQPYIANAKVHTKVIEHGRAKKIIVFRYHNKTRTRKKKGHRQEYTKLQITEITL